MPSPDPGRCNSPWPLSEPLSPRSPSLLEKSLWSRLTKEASDRNGGFREQGTMLFGLYLAATRTAEGRIKKRREKGETDRVELEAI